MKFACIAPPKIMNLSLMGCMGYHMVLGQYLVRDQKYRLEVSRLVYEGKFVIVDNGAAEPEEERVPFTEIVDVALKLGVDEIVLPDVLRNRIASAKATRAAADLVPPNKRMVVPHGSSITEWRIALDALADGLEFATVGVPKYLESFTGGRIAALADVPQRWNYHFLGIWASPKNEITRASATSKVRGIDSGAPVAWAQNDTRITDDKVRYSLSWTKGADPLLVERNLLDCISWSHYASHYSIPDSQHA